MKLQNVLELHTGRKISNMATAENYIKGLSDKIKEFMIKLLKNAMQGTLKDKQF